MKNENLNENVGNNKPQKTNGFVNWIKENWWKVLVSFGSVAVVAVLASIFTNTESEWYLSLVKPAFNPPAIVFPIVWGIIYTSLAIVLFVLIYKNQGNKKIYIIFGINGLINILWALVFFTLQSTIFGLIMLALNLLAGVLLFLEVRKVNKNWSYVLLGYVAWLAFAFVLNYMIYMLN